jgi:hypothetical protein
MAGCHVLAPWRQLQSDQRQRYAAPPGQAHGAALALRQCACVVRQECTSATCPSGSGSGTQWAFLDMKAVAWGMPASACILDD